MKTRTLAGLLLFVLFSPANAAEPTLDSIWPPGAKIGTEIEVTLTGRTDPWPCQVHCSDPNVSFKPAPKKKGTGKIVVKKEAKPGPVLIRLFNNDGVSEPVIFTLSNQTELLEDEKDDNTVSKAQAVPANKIPCVINGKLAKTDEVDSYRIPLKKGQTLYAALDGYALQSPIDPTLHLYNSRGVRIALAHDNAVNLDPQIAFPVTADGEYTLSVMAFTHPASARVNFVGSSKSVYRIHLATDSNNLPARLLPVPLKADGKTLTIPGQVDGTISKPGEIDTFAISAKKGQSLYIKAESFRFRYPTDPLLFLRKEDGKLIAKIDDTKPTRDAGYLWKVPADGKYQIQVADRFRRGEKEFRYRLSVAPPEGGFSATVDKSRYILKPGKSIDIKIKLTRKNSHKTKLELRATGLPKGVHLELPKSIPEKSGDVAAKLTASADCKKASVPFRLFLKEKEGKKPKEQAVVFSFQNSASRGPFLIDETPEIWMTVVLPPPKKAEVKKEKKE